MKNTNLSPDIVQQLIFYPENKIKVLRKNKNLSISELSKLSNVSEESIRSFENNPIEMPCSDIKKIAHILDIEEELLLDTSYWFSNQDMRFLDMLFLNAGQNHDLNLLKKQVVNWAGVILHQKRKIWEDSRRTSIDILCTLRQKEKAKKYRKLRDEQKYAPFRKFFKDLQKQKYLEGQKKNKPLSARGFAKWFLENTPPHIEIPYVKQNQFNKLNQLAQQNNREFKENK